METFGKKTADIHKKLFVWIEPALVKCKNIVMRIYVFLLPAFLIIKKILAPVCRVFKKAKPGLMAFNLILALYITIVVMLHNISIPISNIKAVCASGILLLCLVYLAITLFVREFNVAISRNKNKKMLSWKTICIFLIVSAIVFAIFYINFMEHYPGGISTDNVDQWKQVQSKVFDNLHPAIHSMLIWLVTRIVNNYAFVIKIQILCFALMSGYLSATLVSWGIKMRWIAVFVFIILSPRTTYGILLYAWKDNAFTIILMCLTAYMVNIVFSDGVWLKKWYNIAAFSIVFALSSLLRHNGIFFTVPLLLAILFFIRKAKLFTVITIAASLLAVFGITNGLYKSAKVKQHEAHVYYEAVGLPMTILGGVLVNNGEALDDETRQFLFKIANEQYWKRNFKTGDYNSVKWSLYEHQMEVIKEIPPKDLLNMTVKAIKNAPNEALREFIGLTGYVWDPFYHDGNIVYWNNGTTLGFLYTREEMTFIKPTKDKYTEINKKIKEVLDLITPYRLLTSVGLNMLALLIAGIYSMNRNLGYKSLFLFIPIAAFNICTMLIISGPEYRYFHFNTVITFPLILALLARVKGRKGRKIELRNEGKWG